MRFRKKPVVIKAWQWLGEARFMPTWLSDYRNEGKACTIVAAEATIEIPTLEGVMTAQIGDWIIQGVKGELYPCKPDIFQATYEPVETVLHPGRSD